MRRLMPPPEFGRGCGASCRPAHGGQRGVARARGGDGPHRSEAGAPRRPEPEPRVDARGHFGGLAPGRPAPPGARGGCATHREAGLRSVTGEHYEGGHWLGTFAVYLRHREGNVARRPHTESLATALRGAEPFWNSRVKTPKPRGQRVCEGFLAPVLPVLPGSVQGTRVDGEPGPDGSEPPGARAPSNTRGRRPRIPMGLMVRPTSCTRAGAASSTWRRTQPHLSHRVRADRSEVLVHHGPQQHGYVNYTALQAQASTARAQAARLSYTLSKADSNLPQRQHLRQQSDEPVRPRRATRGRTPRTSATTSSSTVRTCSRGTFSSRASGCTAVRGPGALTRPRTRTTSCTRRGRKARTPGAATPSRRWTCASANLQVRPKCVGHDLLGDVQQRSTR